MIVWEYEFPDERYARMTSVDEISLDFYNKWREGIKLFIPKMKLTEVQPRKKRPTIQGDFPPIYSGLMAISEKALDVYKDAFNQNTKYLPIDCNDNTKYYLLDIPLIDCLDYETSVIDYLKSEPTKILGIDGFAFKLEMVADEIIFRIPESKARIFVTDQFIDKAKAAGLKGIRFNKVWDSEVGSFNLLAAMYNNDLILE